MTEDRIKKAFERITDQTPRAPRWEEMVEDGLRAPRRPQPLTAFVAGAAAVVVVLGIVGLLRDTGGGGPVASPTTTTAPPPATTEPTPPVSAGPITAMACGSLVAPYSTTIPDGEALGPEGEAAVAALSENEEGRFFTDEHELRLWSQGSETLTLLGRSTEGYGYAEFRRNGADWEPTGWGGCHWEPVAEGFGLATWVLAETPGPAATTILLNANERHCASGQPPEGREVVAAVISDDVSVTVTILVEPVQGGAECPSNPDFPFTVDLGEPLGDRVLFDGSEVPPVPRSPDGSGVTCEATDWEGTTPNEVAVHFPCGDEEFHYQPVARELHPGTSPVGSALRHLLAGPSDEERSLGFSSWFSEETADALISVSLENGRLVADFNDGILVNNASTSSGAVGFNNELRVNLFAFKEVDSIEFRINGSCEGWSAYFESDGCWIVTRQAYEEGTAPFSP